MRSRSLITSLMTLANYSGEALLPWGMMSHWKSRVEIQKAVSGMMSLSMGIWWDEDVEQGKYASFSQGIKDLVDAGGGELAQRADGVDLVVVHRYSDDQGYGRGNTPFFINGFEPLGRVTVYLTDKHTFGSE